MPIAITVDEGLTELETIDPDRVDGVIQPANGIPTLMFKSLGEPASPEKEEEPVVPETPAVAKTAETPEVEAPETPAAEEPQADEVEKANAVSELVKAAVTKATKPLEDELRRVSDELAKVLAKPIPGGPMLTAPASMRAQRVRDDELAKAAHFERLANAVTESDLRSHYQQLAQQARAAAVQPAH